VLWRLTLWASEVLPPRLDQLAEMLPPGEQPRSVGAPMRFRWLAGELEALDDWPGDPIEAGKQRQRAPMVFR